MAKVLVNCGVTFNPFVIKFNFRHFIQNIGFNDYFDIDVLILVS